MVVIELAQGLVRHGGQTCAVSGTEIDVSREILESGGRGVGLDIKLRDQVYSLWMDANRAYGKWSFLQLHIRRTE